MDRKNRNGESYAEIVKKVLKMKGNTKRQRFRRGHAMVKAMKNWNGRG